jgi:ubiquinone/menaquinone biosynthesis C-methylase UbiE
MQAGGWERIYRERGELHFRVLPKIKRASILFRARGYRDILDLGCGTGRHSIFLAEKGFNVYATDNAPTGIEIARKKAESLGLNNLHFRQHDMRKIPFPDSFFDAVICTWAIHHGTLKEIQKSIDEIYRVLKPGGMVVADLLSVGTESYGLGREIERDTFIGKKTLEEDVPHHYSSRQEIVRLFSEFRQVNIRLSTRYYKGNKGKKHVSKRFNVRAVK